MDARMAEQIYGSTWRSELRNTTQQLTSASGHPLSVAGVIHDLLRIGDAVVAHCITVIDGQRVPFLLGNDFLMANGINIVKGKTLEIETGNQKQEIPIQYNEARYNVKARRTQTVAPYCVQFIASRLEPETKEHVTYPHLTVLQEEVAGGDTIQMVDSVTCIEPGGFIYSLIANTDGEVRVITEGDLIGVARSVSPDDAEVDEQDESIDLQLFVHEETERDKILYGSPEGFNPIPAGYDQTSNAQPFDITKMIDALTVSHLTHEQTQLLKAALRRYQGVFSTGPGDYGKTPLLSFKIDTGDCEPIAARYRPVPVAYEKEVKGNIDDMIKNGILEKCDSPWNSTLVILRKPDGKLRMCVNLKNVNAVTVNKTSFPINQQEQSFAKISKGKYFFRLDLSQAYYSIPINDEEDRNKTAFSAFGQQYRFRVSPFGARFLPSKFNQLMTIIFEGLEDFLFHYFDDVIGAFDTFESLIKGLTTVMFRLIQANMRVNFAKSDFCLTNLDRIKWLGTIIHNNQILPDPEKTRTITEMTIPRDKKAMMRFLGMVGYHRRHLPRLAQIAEPLYKIVGSTATYLITEKEQAAFDGVKRLLASAEALTLPDLSEPFIVTCDASDVAIGGVLSQKNKEDPQGPEKIVAYCSRTFTANEQHCSSCEKELLAILYSLSVFHYYVANTRFTLRSDSKSLVYLRHFKDNGKLFRASMFLDELDFDIQHMSAKRDNLMMVADTISRAETRNPVGKTKRPSYKDLRNPVFDELTKPPELTNEVVTKKDFITAADEYLRNFVKDNEGRIAANPYKSPRVLGTREGDHDGHLFQKTVDTSEELCAYLNALDREIIHQGRPIEKPEHVRTITLQRPFLTRDEFQKAQEADPKITELKQRLQQNPSDGRYQIQHGILTRNRKTANGICKQLPVVPEVLKVPLLEHLHGTEHGPHVGRKRLTMLIHSHFYWPGVDKIVQRYCTACTACQYQMPNTSPQVILGRQMFATRPNEVVSWDIVGPYPPAYDGERYVLTVQCEFSRFVLAFPLKSKKPEGLLRAFVTGWVAPFGAPKYLRSDEGTDTDSALAQYVCKSLGITKITTPIYSPQANPIERWHATLNNALRATLTYEEKRYWATLVPMIAMKYNQGVHTVTKIKPVELFLGRDTTQDLIPVIPDGHPAIDHHRYLKELKRSQEISWALARKQREHSHPKGAGENEQYQVGDMVLVRNHAPKDKLDDKWTGPYRILERRSNTCIVIRWNLTIDAPVLVRFHHQPRDMGEIIKRKVHTKDLKPFKATPIIEDKERRDDKIAEQVYRELMERKGQEPKPEPHMKSKPSDTQSQASAATGSRTNTPSTAPLSKAGTDTGGTPSVGAQSDQEWGDMWDNLGWEWEPDEEAEIEIKGEPEFGPEIKQEDIPEIPRDVKEEPEEPQEWPPPAWMKQEPTQGILDDADPHVQRVMETSVLPFLHRARIDKRGDKQGRHAGRPDTQDDRETGRIIRHLTHRLTVGSLADLQREAKARDKYQEHVQSYERLRAIAPDAPPPPQPPDFTRIRRERAGSPMRAAAAATQALAHWQTTVPRKVKAFEKELSKWELEVRRHHLEQEIDRRRDPSNEPTPRPLGARPKTTWGKRVPTVSLQRVDDPSTPKTVASSERRKPDTPKAPQAPTSQ